MFKEKSPDPKYGSKTTMKGMLGLKLRTQNRIKPCLKFGVILSIIWLCGYLVFVYVSTYKSELLDEFKKEDSNIKKLQQKVSDLVAIRFPKDDHNQLDRMIKEDQENRQSIDEVVEQDDGITPEAYKFMRELGLHDPGENGEPVELPKNLSDDIQKRVKEGYDTVINFHSRHLQLF